MRERQTMALCVYCGSSMRIDADSAKPQTMGSAVMPDALNQVNQLLLDGRRAELSPFTGSKRV
jgi:hypothetical protein